MGRGLRLQTGSGKIVCALMLGRVSVLTLSITEEVLTHMEGGCLTCVKALSQKRTFTKEEGQSRVTERII